VRRRSKCPRPAVLESQASARRPALRLLSPSRRPLPCDLGLAGTAPRPTAAILARPAGSCSPRTGMGWARGQQARPDHPDTSSCRKDHGKRRLKIEVEGGGSAAREPAVGFSSREAWPRYRNPPGPAGVEDGWLPWGGAPRGRREGRGEAGPAAELDGRQRTMASPYLTQGSLARNRYIAHLLVRTKSAIDQSFGARFAAPSKRTIGPRFGRGDRGG
jgi:hypothetical protein